MEYKLIRSRRRYRSASLNVNLAGEIVVRAPLYMPKLYIDNFVQKSLSWIAKRRTHLALPRPKPRRFFTKVQLEVYIHAQVAKYGELLRLYPSGIRLTQATTYWGSCSPHHLLSFSTRLCFAPPATVEYVVVHELCHLRFAGHGPRFWTLVKQAYPKTNEMKRVLRLLSYGTG